MSSGAEYRKVEDALGRVAWIALGGKRPEDQKTQQALIRAAELAGLLLPSGDEAEKAHEAAVGIQNLSCRGILPDAARISLVAMM